MNVQTPGAHDGFPPVEDDRRAYAVIAEGDGFHNVIAALGGIVWGPAPYTLCGQWIVILPGSVELRHGPLSAGGHSCTLVGVSPLPR